MKTPLTVRSSKPKFPREPDAPTAWLTLLLATACGLATFFAGGAPGAALGGLTYAQGGWSLAMGAAVSPPMQAFAFYLTE